MGNIVTVGPNEALIVSGGWSKSSSNKIIIGGWAWAWGLVSNVQKLSLEIMTIKPKCERVETAQGVPLSVTGIAQCKVMTDKEFLPIAAEQLLGMSVTEIKYVLLETLEGHLRAILGGRHFI
jgi:flotillin